MKQLYDLIHRLIGRKNVSHTLISSAMRWI